MGSGSVDPEHVLGANLQQAHLVAGFTQWLTLQHYEPTTVRSGPVRLSEFLVWLGDRSADRATVEAFFTYLAGRKNKRRSGALTIGTLRTYQRTLRLYGRYLRMTGLGSLDVPVTFAAEHTLAREIFTQDEIRRLYRATDASLLGVRDRAMLAIYYGCGLRRSEGVHLELGDLLVHKHLVHVRRGKNATERYVPMVGTVRKDLLAYVHDVRPALLVRAAHQALFLSIRGRPLGASQMYERLQRLQREAGLTKRLGLHALRHSIATHLLHGGMPLEQIRRFLGHRSLESTQIYTHVCAAALAKTDRKT